MNQRSYPQFSLCGLNCILCPRYNSTSLSRCPGCGGEDFPDKHPNCSIISCNHRKEKKAFCFECSQFPCSKYPLTDEKDSFISYLHRQRNMIYAQKDLDAYLEELQMKHQLLTWLLEKYNDGRSLSYFCTAVNNLELDDLFEIERDIDSLTTTKSVKDRISLLAQKRNITIGLRK